MPVCISVLYHVPSLSSIVVLTVLFACISLVSSVSVVVSETKSPISALSFTSSVQRFLFSTIFSIDFVVFSSSLSSFFTIFSVLVGSSMVSPVRSIGLQILRSVSNLLNCVMKLKFACEIVFFSDVFDCSTNFSAVYL